MSNSAASVEPCEKPTNVPLHQTARAACAAPIQSRTSRPLQPSGRSKLRRRRAVGLGSELTVQPGCVDTGTEDNGTCGGLSFGNVHPELTYIGVPLPRPSHEAGRSMLSQAESSNEGHSNPSSATGKSALGRQSHRQPLLRSTRQSSMSKSHSSFPISSRRDGQDGERGGSFPTENAPGSSSIRRIAPDEPFGTFGCTR